MRLAGALLLLVVGTARAHSDDAPDNCVVTDDDGNVVFDLAHLYRSNADKDPNYFVDDARENNKYKYYINVCGILTDVKTPCQKDQSKDWAACQTLTNETALQTDTQFPVAIGVYNKNIQPKLVDKDNLDSGVELSYPAAPASPGSCSRRTKIIFLCGPGRGLPVFLYESNDCEYMFEWRTDLVCTNQDHAEEVDCTVQDDNGAIIDLSPLVSSSDNWWALDTRPENYTYLINVCRPLAQASKYPGTCNTSGAGICQLKPSDPTFIPKALGQFSEPQFANGKVFIELTQLSDKCDNGFERSSRIDFTCTTNPSIGLGHPVYLEEVACRYYFQWQTIAACPLGSGGSSGASTSSGTNTSTSFPCQVSDAFGNNYDLTPLQKLPFSGIEGGGRGDLFHLGICNKSSACDGAACVEYKTNTGSVVLGALANVSTGRLQVTDGVLTLTYRGAACNNTAAVDILFQCDPTMTPDSLEADSSVAATWIFGKIGFDELTQKFSQDCYYQFVVLTSLACVQKSVDCTVVAAGHSFDLAPLSKVTGNWYVPDDREDGKYAYELNVCRPLVATKDTKGCPPTAGICQVPGSDTVDFPPTALGLAGKPRYVNNTLSLVYEHGAQCPNGVFRTTTIFLNCAPGLGSPVFTNEGDNCDYFFTWDTSVACAETTETGTSCKVTDSATGATIDLSSLADYGPFHWGPPSGGYSLGLCKDAGSPCPAGVGVCSGSHSFGQTSSALSVSDGLVTLSYNHGSTCKGTFTSNTLIEFNCAPGVDGRQGPLATINDECTLLLRWDTNLVCQDQFEPVQCVVFDDEYNLYDLTELLQPYTNYQMDTGSGFFEINVCRPLVAVSGTNCPGNAAACLIQKNHTGLESVSLGQPSAPMWDPKNKNVYIVYTNGTGGCNGDSKMQRSSHIDFYCPDDEAEETEPRLVIFEQETCTYYFEWYTMAACPVRIVTGANCKITDDVTGTTIDLSPLSSKTHTGYVVQAAPYVYTLDICQPVYCASSTFAKPQSGPNPQSAGACQTKPSEATFDPRVMGTANSALLFRDNHLSLVYDHGDKCEIHQKNRQTVIAFVCDPTVDVGFPTYVHEPTDCTYLFEWRTSYACYSQVECRVTDPVRGLDYHLDELTRHDANWVAMDEREGGKYEYEINVCRPLVPTAQWDCGPFAAACQKSKDGDYEMGLVSGPQIAADGTLFLEYTNGAPCYGSPGQTRTTHIDFACATTTGRPGTPIFDAELNCTYYFTWVSSAACNRGSSSGTVGSNCQITEPTSGETFKLDTITPTSLSVTWDEYTYYVSLCAGLTATAAGGQKGCVGAGVCQTKASDPSFSAKLGQVSTAPFYSDDTIMLNYTNGDGCYPNNQPRFTEIILQCDSKATTPSLEYRGESRTCQYAFEIKSAAVCPKAVEFPCTAYDFEKGLEYDLTEMIKDGSDYSGQDQSSDHADAPATFTMNICRNLVQAPNAKCKGKTAVCAHYKGQYYSLGDATYPTVDSEHFLIFQLTGGQCMENPSQSANTTILMTCGAVEREPVLAYVPTACNYYFVWTTPYACAISQATTVPAPTEQTLSSDDCVVQARDGAVYDLRDLAKAVPTISPPVQRIGADMYRFTVALCGSLLQGCNSHGDAAACQTNTATKNEFSLGRFVEKLKYESGELSLTYAGGDICEETNKPRETVIRFLCDATAGTGMPYFKGESSVCAYEFEWKTSYACASGVPPSPPIDCQVQKGADLFDLSVLQRPAGTLNWLALIDGNSTTANEFDIYINPCGPLNFFAGMGECAGASICILTDADEKDTLAAGAATAEPLVLSNGDVQMTYTLPSTFKTKCKLDNVLRSAVITFTCEIGTLGEPEFLGETDLCQYQFIWRTSAACAASTQVVGSQCQVTDPKSGTVYDLSALSTFTPAPLFSPDNVYQFHVSVCGRAQGCDNPQAGACQIDTSQGNQQYSMGMSNDKLILNDNAVSLVYSNGDVCYGSGVARTTIISFICDPTKGLGQPTVVGEKYECNYFIEWRTAEACGSTADVECITHNGQGQEIDLTPLKMVKGTANWQVDNQGGSDVYLYYINVCHSLLPSSDASKPCSAKAGACQIDTAPAVPVAYNMGRVTSGPKWSSTDHAIVMQYSHGDPCLDGKPRNTTILFTCPPPSASPSPFPLGQPVFTKEPSTCNYIINWQTSAACPVSTAASIGCQVRDPLTNTLYDLVSLPQTSTYYNDGTFTLSPCDTTGEYACNGARASGCQQTRNAGSFSLGVSQGLRVTEEGLSMTLVGGTLCKDKFQRSARITFECSESDNLEFLNEQDDCTYSFLWRTKKACGLPLASSQCLVKSVSGWTFDLDELAVAKGAVTVADPHKLLGGGTMVINVCAAVTDSLCKDNMGACLKQADGTSRSLGTFDGVKPLVTADGTVTLTYPTGDGCVNGPGSTAETIVTFVCSTDSKAKGPELTKISQDLGGKCQYLVQWKTCHVCPNPCHETTVSQNYGSSTTQSSGAGDSSSVVKAHSSQQGVTVAVVVILVVVVVLGAFLMTSAERRSRLCGLLGAAPAPVYKYSKVTDVEMGTTGTSIQKLLEGEEEEGDETDEDDTLLVIK